MGLLTWIDQVMSLELFDLQHGHVARWRAHQKQDVRENTKFGYVGKHKNSNMKPTNAIAQDQSNPRKLGLDVPFWPL